MNTDDLMAKLAADLAPAPRRAFERRAALALPLGVLVSMLIVVLGYGVRPDFGEAIGAPMLWVKFAWPAAIAAIAWRSLERLATPGRALGRVPAMVWVPVGAMAALAAVAWIDAPGASRASMLLGSTWTTCSVSILLSALPILAATRWALVRAAPTDLPRAGAAAGLLAGSMGTVVYALHCPEVDAPFLLVWNGLGMVMAAALGALLAPRLLRW